MYDLLNVIGRLDCSNNNLPYNRHRYTNEI